MSIENIKQLNKLVDKRTNKIMEKYSATSRINPILREFFNENLFYYSDNYKCPVIYGDNEWVVLDKKEKTKGQIRNALEKNAGFLALEQKDKREVINTVIEDVSLFNLNSRDRKYTSNVVYFNNGIYNHRSKKWELDKEAKDKYKFINFEYFIGRDYNPNAKRDILLDKYLDLLSDTPINLKVNDIEDEAQREYKRELLLSSMSVGLNFKPMRLFINTYGKGGSGKSSYYKLLTSIINTSENKLAIPIKYGDLDRNSHKTADLMNKTMIYQTESIASISNELLQSIKQLSSGGDEIDYNIKFGATGSMVNTAKPFINSNDMIVFKDSTGAIDDRLLAISINVGEDSEFWLTNDEFEELFPNGKLRKSAVDYLLKLVIDNFKEEKELKALANKITESVELKREIMEAANPIETWIKYDMMKEFSEIWQREWNAKELYEKFKEYQLNNSENEKFVMTITTFGSKLLGVLNEIFKEEGFWRKVRRSDGNVYYFTKKGEQNE